MLNITDIYKGREALQEQAGCIVLRCFVVPAFPQLRAETISVRQLSCDWPVFCVLSCVGTRYFLTFVLLLVL